MHKLLHLKKTICKLLTCLIPKKQRGLCREALYWFTIKDYLRFKNVNYHIVSLGANCLPRGLSTAIKLKPRRFYGEKSCPFDLNVNTDLKRISHFIETDFTDYFKNITVNKQNFPHDYKLPYNKLVERYKKRIQNFQNIMQSKKIIYFIHSNYASVPAKEDVLSLYATLKNKRQNKPFKLILLTSEYINDLPEIIQIPEKFTIDDEAWLVYIIDEYNEFNNKYTQYRDRMEKKLTKVIFDNYFC